MEISHLIVTVVVKSSFRLLTPTRLQFSPSEIKEKHSYSTKQISSIRARPHVSRVFNNADVSWHRPAKSGGLHTQITSNKRKQFKVIPQRSFINSTSVGSSTCAKLNTCGNTSGKTFKTSDKTLTVISNKIFGEKNAMKS